MLKSRQKLDKYRIQMRIAEGGFATVFKALDTIEGIHVALKVPHSYLLSTEVLQDFRREVRLAARLDHQNVLPLKNASYIDGHFVIAYALGDETLDERLRRRMAFTTALNYAEQLLTAVAYAHRRRIIHCDIKPENVILFPDYRLRLADFGIARVAQKTIRASGSGTVGFMAPEQAMGRPSFRSDVFSLGLILYRIFSGKLPEWPFKWPPPGYINVRRRLHPEFIRLIERSLDVRPFRRFRDADHMLAAFGCVKNKTVRFHATRSKNSKKMLKNGKRKRRRC